MYKKTTRRAEQQGRSKTRRGRPRVHMEPWVKVSVVLFTRQIGRLDRLTRAVQRKTGKTMTRAEIIRALIDGLIKSRVDLSDHASEAALRSHVAARLFRDH